MAYNTRIAPSPTGYFHLGTARTAYFNWLAARATGGRFLLRIDDTDAKRNDERMTQVIYEAMDWLGLNWDETFAQSERHAHYRGVAEYLIGQKRAVARDGAIFLNYRSPTEAFHDLALRADVRITKLDEDYIRNMVLIKSDGSPTYHFASVIDDIDYSINFVIRGSDHTQNTFKQLALYAALDVQPPKYAHVGLMHALDGGKLSKSKGAPSLLDYKDQGIDPEAMLSFLLRLGWGPKRDDKSTSVLDRRQALELFLTGGNLRNQPSKVDFAKLASLDKRFKNASQSQVARAA